MSKRLFDLFFAICGLLVLWPLFLVVAITILLNDGWPIFFRQDRVGRYGRLFKIWKFRTMKVQSIGLQITVEGDERITPTGKLLRKYKIDEIPQLINVLIGEMSFVGPRPEVQKYVNKYNQDQKEVLNYKPGITSPASVIYKSEDQDLIKAVDIELYYIKKVMPDKIKIDCNYFKKSSFRGDLSIVLKTIFGLISSVFRRPAS